MKATILPVYIRHPPTPFMTSLQLRKRPLPESNDESPFLADPTGGRRVNDFHGKGPRLGKEPGGNRGFEMSRIHKTAFDDDILECNRGLTKEIRPVDVDGHVACIPFHCDSRLYFIDDCFRVEGAG